MTKQARPRGPQRSRGTVLVVGMIVLLILIVLGIGGMRSSALQELMAGHVKDSNTAFQAAEAAMQAALTYLAAQRNPPVLKQAGDSVSWTGNPIWRACEVADPDPAAESAATVFDPCNTLNAVIDGWRSYPETTTTLGGQVITSALSGIGTANQPHYIIESRVIEEEQLPPASIHYWTVTAVGFDAATRSRVILQTTITREFTAPP